MPFQPAVKRNAKLRFAVSGPAGSGKTFTLLKLATELTGADGKIAYIDTEHGSASKYAHTAACSAGCTDTSHFSFDVIEPAKFDPRDLMAHIDEAVSGGYAVVSIDSLSHYWMGPDGELEMVDNAAKNTRGNSFAAWKTVTPIHNNLVDKLLSAPIHILVAMRTKTEWVVEKNEQTGKSTPRKIGLAPVMRDGIEFEFDVCGDIDQENTLMVTKSRCSALAGKSFNRPGKEFAAVLKTWLASPGAEEPTAPVVPAGSTNGEAIPAPLRALHEGLMSNKPGYAKQGLQLVLDRIKALLPTSGAMSYSNIIKSHGIGNGKPASNAVVWAAILEVWNVCDVAEAEQAQVGDEALPEDLFNQPEMAHQ